MMTSGLPSIILPEPPQWLVASPRRTAGVVGEPLGLPCAAFQVLGPQQALCTPGSPTRRAAAVNEDIRRTADGRAGDGVRAAVLAVTVGGAEGFIAYAAGWGHTHLTVLGYPAHQPLGKVRGQIFFHDGDERIYALRRVQGDISTPIS